MVIPDNIKRFAKADGSPVVKYLCDWKGMKVYSAFDPEFPYVGLPQYILADGESLRWANTDETEEIMAIKRPKINGNL